MTFNLIEKGLQLLIANNEQTTEAIQALVEIAEIKQRLGNYNDIWKDICYLLPATTIDNILINDTYDAFGELYQKAANINHDVSFNDYEHVCRQRCNLEYAPLSVIQMGFEVVGSLYLDNEENGCHESCNKTPMNDLLDTIDYFLTAYETTNKEALLPAEMYSLKQAQTTVSILKRHTEELDKITVND